MTKRTISLLLMLLLSLSLLCGGSFQEYAAKTVSGDDFDFPDDALEDAPVVFALAMGTSRDSGEIQQNHLLQWESYLKTQKSPLTTLRIFHFPIIEAPRFVHGVIRRGIGKSYEDVVPEDQAAVIFIKDTEEFAEQAEIPLDDLATVVLVLPDGTIAGYVKGPPSPQAKVRLESLYSEFVNR